MSGSLAADVILDQILRRILLSIFTGAFWLAVTFMALRILRVKNPAIKYLFFTIALTKSLMALIRETPQTYGFKGVLAGGFQMPNLGAFLPSLPGDAALAAGYRPSLSFSPLALMVIVVSAIAFTIWRLAGLIKFNRLLSGALELERANHENVFNILDRLVKKTNIPYPVIVGIEAKDTPFTVGIKRPVIAIAPSVFNRLDDDEAEAVLAHEIAHISRKDYLFHWPIVIVRDVLFFNPITNFVYKRISFERERACDDFSSRLSQPLTLAKSLIKIAEMQQEQQELPLVRAFAPRGLISKRESYFARRVSELVDPKAYWPPTLWRTTLIWIVAITFFMVEFHIIISINGSQLVLI